MTLASKGPVIARSVGCGVRRLKIFFDRFIKPGHIAISCSAVFTIKTDLKQKETKKTKKTEMRTISLSLSPLTRGEVTRFVYLPDISKKLRWRLLPNFAMA
jgi:hypothetical protein